MNRVIAVAVLGLCACGVPEAASSESSEGELVRRDPCAGLSESACVASSACRPTYDLSGCPACPPNTACSPCPPSAIKFAACVALAAPPPADPCSTLDAAQCAQKSTCEWSYGTCPVCPPNTACAPCPPSGRCAAKLTPPPSPPPAVK
jgi:hypothetical protein